MNKFELDNNTGENHTGNHPNIPVKLLTASAVIDDKVYNPAGDELGKIKDIMLNLQSERIEYLIIEFGGFLGMGEKYFAFPLKDFTIDTDRHAFVLNKSKEEFEHNPGFDKEHWPETNTHEKEGASGGWGGFMGSNTGSEY